MGKSLKGKELGKGIRQREDGLYVARSINRFGKRQVIYDKTYNGIQKKMREAQYVDENAINVVNTNMTLDEWYEKWMYTCKKNCRGNTKRSYAIHYKRVQPDLGWRTVEETEIFLEEAKSSIYYNLFIVALETGMRIGELSGLQWDDIDFNKKVVHVKHSMAYVSNAERKYVFELHPTKTNKGLRVIPLTKKAAAALRRQYFLKQTIINSGKEPLKGYENLVFVTKYLEAEVPLKTVSALLGHAQLQLTTDLYMHVTNVCLQVWHSMKR